MSQISQPLGVVLQQAGLVSATQVEMALKEQRQANQLRLGEILAKRGWIKQETADFFAQRWFTLSAKKRPLGQYLKEAALLDESQIRLILAEQKRSGKRFGDIAVAKKWLEETTLNFFLQQLQSPYQTFKLQLDARAECPYTVLEVILKWTNHHPILTATICQLIEQSQILIATGEENAQVERLVRSHIVDNWEQGIAADHLRTMRDRLLKSAKDPMALLLLYQEVWQQGASVDGSPEQAALLDIGLVTEHQQMLKVANPIYHAVFNYKWVVLEIAKLIEAQLNLSPAQSAQRAIALPLGQRNSNTSTYQAPKRLLLLVLAVCTAGAAFGIGINVLPRLLSISTSPPEAPSTESEPAPLEFPPVSTSETPSSETSEDSGSVLPACDGGSCDDSGRIGTFATGTTGEELRQALGEPTRNSQGYWANSRAWLYQDVVPEQVDLGYLLDASTGRVRQTEGSFAQAVSLPDIQTALEEMLGGTTPATVQDGLARVYQRQQNRYSFTTGNLEGVIERNEQDRIYIGVWEADFH